MGLLRINQVAEAFGISSRTLRYYEQVGILWSSRPGQSAQRHYDAAALERLGQIIVLRKLQIPVRDIVKIFEGEDTAALIQAFVDKLASLDGELATLSELRRVVDEFLQKMTSRGISKISALPLLYEETEKRLALSAEKQGGDFERLSRISRRALQLHDVRIIRLPPMRMLTSRLKTGELVSLDEDNMQNLFAGYGFGASPGMHSCFYRREEGDSWLMLMQIPADYDNGTLYLDAWMSGGLFAVASSFMADMDDTFLLLRDWVGGSGDFALDMDGNGQLPRSEMIEEILPWDIARRLGRYQQDLWIPIRLKEGEETVNG